MSEYLQLLGATAYKTKLYHDARAQEHNPSVGLLRAESDTLVRLMRLMYPSYHPYSEAVDKRWANTVWETLPKVIKAQIEATYR